MYDLLLKGGTVVDPSRNVHEKLDLGVTGNRITGLASSIDVSEAVRVVDVSGKLVVPGLIDNHIHAYDGPRRPQHPDIAGVFGGVTTAADAGRAGPDNFQDFCDVILAQSQTRIYCFLSIFRDRNREAMRRRSATSTEGWDIDIDGVVRLAGEYPDVVKGIKIQLSSTEFNAIGLKHLEAAKVASRKANIPVLLHVGDGRKGEVTPPKAVGRAIAMLDAGDTVTHVFGPCTGSTVDEEGKLLPEVLDAQSRGVFMDTAYGDNKFGWAKAESVMSQGLVPDSIGSDLQIQGHELNHLRSLLEQSSFLLHLGFSVDEVLRMITITPARFLRIEDRAGSLALGRDADIAVIDLADGNWEFKDANNVIRVGSQALVPVLTVKSGRVIDPGPGLHPWGWAPPTVAAIGVAV